MQPVPSFPSEKRLNRMLWSLVLVVPYFGAIMGDLPSEVRRIARAHRYSSTTAEVLSTEKRGRGKYGQTFLTLRFEGSELEIPQSDLTKIGALPFLFPLPKTGEKSDVYVDGQIVSGSTPALAAISLLVKAALIAWIVLVLKFALANASRPERLGRRRGTRR